MTLSLYSVFGLVLVFLFSVFIKLIRFHWKLITQIIWVRLILNAFPPLLVHLPNITYPNPSKMFQWWAIGGFVDVICFYLFVFWEKKFYFLAPLNVFYYPLFDSKWKISSHVKFSETLIKVPKWDFAFRLFFLWTQLALWLVSTIDRRHTKSIKVENFKREFPIHFTF